MNYPMVLHIVARTLPILHFSDKEERQSTGNKSTNDCLLWQTDELKRKIISLLKIHSGHQYLKCIVRKWLIFYIESFLSKGFLWHFLKKKKEKKTKHHTSVEWKGKKIGRSLKWCFNHHGEVLSNWHQHGHLGKHKRRAMFYDSNHHGTPLPNKLGKKNAPEGPVSWPSLLMGICMRRSQGKICSTSVPPCVQFGTSMNYTLVCVESGAGISEIPQAYRVGRGRIEIFYLCVCEKVSCWCNERFPRPAFSKYFRCPPPEPRDWISSGDKPEKTVWHPWLLDPHKQGKSF